MSELGCGRINQIQNDPGGLTGILDMASQTSSNVSADRLNIGTFGRVATSVGATPSSDIRTPPNTEEEGDSDYPWRDRMVSRILCGSSSDALGEEYNGCSYSTVSGVASESYADIAVLSDFSGRSG